MSADATSIEIREEPLTFLDTYGRIPIAFEVRTVLDVRVRDGGLGGFELRERVVAPPVTKDYDAVPGDPPADWAKRFDLSRWALFSAALDGEHVGCAAVAFRTPGVIMLDGRSDLAVLWDIRVAPHARGRGVGAALFAEAARWATARGCAWLKVETQNINVPACRFYMSRGCVLGAVDRFAYPDLPDEVQLIWFKELSR